MVMRVLSLTAATSFKSRFLTYLVLFQKIFYLYYLLLGKVQCCTKKVRDFSCEKKKGNLFTKKFFTFHELISTNIIIHIHYEKTRSIPQVCIFAIYLPYMQIDLPSWICEIIGKGSPNTNCK